MIIGSGPAGISAALTAKARNLNFIWFGSRALSTKIEKAEKIMNYPGLPAVILQPVLIMRYMKPKLS